MRQSCAVLAIAIALVVSAGVGAAELNYFEWSAVAPLVAVGESLGENGRFHEFVVETMLRGDLAPGTILRIDLRGANQNRNRELQPRVLRMDAGSRFVVLIEPARSGRPQRAGAYQLVRGSRGVRELPPEGSPAVLDALRRFIEIHEMNSDRMTWQTFAAMLDDNDPLLLRTALEQFRKFNRGDRELLPSVRPLLDHPNDEIRESAARLAGQILIRHAGGDLVEEIALRTELVGRARRDRSTEVRVAATEALLGFEGETVERVLNEIATEDPEQSVRYAAERILLDRRESRTAAGTVGSGGRVPD